MTTGTSLQHEGAPAPAAGPMTLTRHPNTCFYFGEENQVYAYVSTGPVEARLPADARLQRLLALCDGTRSEAEVLAAIVRPDLPAAARDAEARMLIDQAREAGLILLGAPPSDANFDPYGYARPDIHRTMLQDVARTEAFRAALEQVVRPGSTVIDMGTGTGILSLFAARAGASQVHAIEYTSIVEEARKVAAANGCAEQITFHQADASEIQLDVAADVIVSEWLGYFVFSDGMWPAVTRLRERCLSPGGVLVPASVDIFLAPLSDPSPEGPAYWSTRPYGFDFSALRQAETRFTQIRVVPAEALLAEPKRIMHIDCYTAPAVLAFEGRAEFVLSRGGVLDAFCGHFSAELAPGVVLDTAPGAPETHWQQHVFPILPLEVAEGDRVRLTIRGVEAPYDSRLVRILLEGEVSGPAGTRPFAYAYDQ